MYQVCRIMELLCKTETEYTFDEYKWFSRVVENKINEMNWLLCIVVVLFFLLALLSREISGIAIIIGVLLVLVMRKSELVSFIQGIQK